MFSLNKLEMVFVRDITIEDFLGYFYRLYEVFLLRSAEFFVLFLELFELVLGELGVRFVAYEVHEDFAFGMVLLVLLDAGYLR